MTGYQRPTGPLSVPPAQHAAAAALMREPTWTPHASRAKPHGLRSLGPLVIIRALVGMWPFYLFTWAQWRIFASELLVAPGYWLWLGVGWTMVCTIGVVGYTVAMLLLRLARQAPPLLGDEAAAAGGASRPGDSLWDDGVSREVNVFKVGEMLQV